MLIDELEVVSFFEFQLEYPDLLGTYFKAFDKAISREIKMT